jgi:hypothetical protein
MPVCHAAGDERTDLVTGGFQAYAMTGWRVGYAVGNKAIIAAIRSSIYDYECSDDGSGCCYRGLKSVRKTLRNGRRL